MAETTAKPAVPTEAAGSEGNGAPVGHSLKAKVTRTSQPKQADG